MRTVQNIMLPLQQVLRRVPNIMLQLLLRRLLLLLHKTATIAHTVLGLRTMQNIRLPLLLGRLLLLRKVHTVQSILLPLLLRRLLLLHKTATTTQVLTVQSMLPRRLLLYENATTTHTVLTVQSIVLRLPQLLLRRNKMLNVLTCTPKANVRRVPRPMPAGIIAGTVGKDIFRNTPNRSGNQRISIRP